MEKYNYLILNEYSGIFVIYNKTTKCIYSSILGKFVCRKDGKYWSFFDSKEKAIEFCNKNKIDLDDEVIVSKF